MLLMFENSLIKFGSSLVKYGSEEPISTIVWQWTDEEFIDDTSGVNTPTNYETGLVDFSADTEYTQFPVNLKEKFSYDQILTFDEAYLKLKLRNAPEWQDNYATLKMNVNGTEYYSEDNLRDYYDATSDSFYIPIGNLIYGYVQSEFEDEEEQAAYWDGDANTDPYIYINIKDRNGNDIYADYELGNIPRYMKYPTWYTELDENTGEEVSQGAGVISLNELEDCTRSGYPSVVMTLNSAVDITDAKFSMTCDATENPVMLMYLIDEDGNYSDYINIGRISSSTSSSNLLEAFSTDTSNHHSIVDNSVLDSQDLSSFYGSFDPSKLKKISICIANWYQTSPTWKARSKTVTINSMKFEK